MAHFVIIMAHFIVQMRDSVNSGPLTSFGAWGLAHFSPPAKPATVYTLISHCECEPYHTRDAIALSYGIYCAAMRRNLSGLATYGCGRRSCLTNNGVTNPKLSLAAAIFNGRDLPQLPYSDLP